MHIGWPQGIYLALIFIGICVHASKNGQPREGRYDLGATIFSAGATILVLWWGGFFS